MAVDTAPDRTLDEMVALMAEARVKGRAGVGRRKTTLPVDARPAAKGEVVVSVIKGEGEETRSRPAREGDWVVRSRSAETGQEQHLVGARDFAERYRRSEAPADDDGWQEFRPSGKPMRFYLLPADTKAFTFLAPWGEAMVARGGDAIVQDPANERNVYRVAAAAFRQTYEIVERPTAPQP